MYSHVKSFLPGEPLYSIDQRKTESMKLLSVLNLLIIILMYVTVLVVESNRESWLILSDTLQANRVPSSNTFCDLTNYTLFYILKVNKIILYFVLLYFNFKFII